MSGEDGHGDVGQAVLDQLDIEQYQDLILSVIRLVLQKKDTIVFEDKVIVDLAMSIWISCIVFNQDLLQRIYEVKRDDGA